MFNKKKEIVIGETYLYDVLNETNLAPMTNIVTVVKKADKGNKYIVITPNGDVFESDAKYLTPYTDPEKASVIRCHYGTTEFDQFDVKTLELAETAVSLLNNMLKTVDEIDDNFRELTKFIQDKVAELKDKVKKYADISQYKDSIQIMMNAFEKNKNNKSQYVDNFEKNFDILVNQYLSNILSTDEFIDSAKEVIRQYFPSDMLINDDIDNALSRDDIDILSEKNASAVFDNNYIAIIFAISDEDKWEIEGFYRDESTIDKEDICIKIRDFLYEIYPDAAEDYIPKYKPAVFSIKRSKQ